MKTTSSKIALFTEGWLLLYICFPSLFPDCLQCPVASVSPHLEGQHDVEVLRPELLLLPPLLAGHHLVHGEVQLPGHGGQLAGSQQGAGGAGQLETAGAAAQLVAYQDSWRLAWYQDSCGLAWYQACGNMMPPGRL